MSSSDLRQIRSGLHRARFVVWLALTVTPVMFAAVPHAVAIAPVALPEWAVAIPFGIAVLLVFAGRHLRRLQRSEDRLARALDRSGPGSDHPAPDDGEVPPSVARWRGLSPDERGEAMLVLGLFQSDVVVLALHEAIAVIGLGWAMISGFAFHAVLFSTIAVAANLPLRPSLDDDRELLRIARRTRGRAA